MVKSTEAKDVKSIDLLAIAASLEIDAKKVHELIEKNGKPVTLLAKNLKGKYPDLAPLPDTLPLFRLRKNATINGVYESDTLKLFKDDYMNVKAFDCELNPLDYEIVSFKSGISGYAVIKVDELLLNIAMSCNDNHRTLTLEMAEDYDHNSPFEDEYGNQFDVNGYVGKGTPPSQYVALVPRPEIPLYSTDLIEGHTYEIVGTGLKSRQYGTPLYNIKDEQGKIIKNVIGNAALTRIYDDNGIGAKFSISQRFQMQDKEGNLIKSSGNGKEVWKVKIKDHQAIDLSDIEV